MDKNKHYERNETEGCDVVRRGDDNFSLSWCLAETWRTRSPMCEIQAQRAPSRRDSGCKALRRDRSWPPCLEQSQPERGGVGGNLRGSQGPNYTAQGKIWRWHSLFGKGKRAENVIRYNSHFESTSKNRTLLTWGKSLCKYRDPLTHVDTSLSLHWCTGKAIP